MENKNQKTLNHTFGFNHLEDILSKATSEAESKHKAEQLVLCSRVQMWQYWDLNLQPAGQNHTTTGAHHGTVIYH